MLQSPIQLRCPACGQTFLALPTAGSIMQACAHCGRTQAQGCFAVVTLHPATGPILAQSPASSMELASSVVPSAIAASLEASIRTETARLATGPLMQPAAATAPTGPLPHHLAPAPAQRVITTGLPTPTYQEEPRLMDHASATGPLRAAVPILPRGTASLVQRPVVQQQPITVPILYPSEPPPSYHQPAQPQPYAPYFPQTIQPAPPPSPLPHDSAPFYTASPSYPRPSPSQPLIQPPLYAPAPAVNYPQSTAHYPQPTVQQAQQNTWPWAVPEDPSFIPDSQLRGTGWGQPQATAPLQAVPTAPLPQTPLPAPRRSREDATLTRALALASACAPHLRWVMGAIIAVSCATALAMVPSVLRSPVSTAPATQAPPQIPSVTPASFIPTTSSLLGNAGPSTAPAQPPSTKLPESQLDIETARNLAEPFLQALVAATSLEERLRYVAYPETKKDAVQRFFSDYQNKLVVSDFRPLPIPAKLLPNSDSIFVFEAKTHADAQSSSLIRLTGSDRANLRLDWDLLEDSHRGALTSSKLSADAPPRWISLALRRSFGFNETTSIREKCHVFDLQGQADGTDRAIALCPKDSPTGRALDRAVSWDELYLVRLLVGWSPVEGTPRLTVVDAKNLPGSQG